MRTMKWIGLVGLVLCAGLGKYAEDRGNDFLDCFTAQGGIGFPLPAVELHATHWVTTGAGWTLGTKWGIEGRKAVTRGYAQCGLILPLPLDNLRQDCEKDGALKLFYTYRSQVEEGSTFLSMFAASRFLVGSPQVLCSVSP